MREIVQGTEHGRKADVTTQGCTSEKPPSTRPDCRSVGRPEHRSERKTGPRLWMVQVEPVWRRNDPKGK